jgi:hypothetical protein
LSYADVLVFPTLVGWLWISAMTIHEKDYNLFEKLLPVIDCSMNAVARFGPIDLSSCDL